MSVYTERTAAAANTEAMWFVPDPFRREPLETWWSLSPDVVASFFRVPGFGACDLPFHRQ
jgi:hypothetical protein